MPPGADAHRAHAGQLSRGGVRLSAAALGGPDTSRVLQIDAVVVKFSPHCEALAMIASSSPVPSGPDRRTGARIEIETLLSSTCFTVAAGASNAALTVTARLLHRRAVELRWSGFRRPAGRGVGRGPG